MQINPENISVIIPCFNKEAFIESCISSVTAQSFQPREIVIVDDGSTDGSLAVAQRLAAQHSHIKVYSKLNGGVSDARNYGIERTQGDYIIALDADDQMKTGYIEKVIQALNVSGADLISCEVEMSGGDADGWMPQKYDPYVERYHNILPTLVTFKKDIWKRIGGYSNAYVFNEDWDFFVRAEQYPLAVAHIPEKLFLYRVDPEGLSQQYIKDTWVYSVSLIMTSNESKYPVEKLYKAHTSLGMMPAKWFERFLTQLEKFPGEWLLHFWTGLVHRSRGEVQKAKECFQKAIEFSGGKNWQPYLCLSTIARGEGNKGLQIECLHWVRLLRPDTESELNKILKPSE